MAEPDQARIGAILRREMRTNGYDPHTSVLTVSDQRAAAIAATAAHFEGLFTNRTPADQHLRELYAMPQNAVLTADEAHALTGFFFWTAWATAAERPGEAISYTSNWPHEPLVGNAPTGAIFLWTFVSIFVLLAGIGGLVWYYAREFDVWRRDIEPLDGFATTDLFGAVTITPSMRATAKYFFVVTAMFLAQVVLGIVTAHYAVEGQGLYGLPMAEYFPLCDHPDLAHPARGAVDRDGLAGDRPLRRPAPWRAGTEIPAFRREFPVRQPADHRRRLLRRRMGGDQPPRRRRGRPISGSAIRAMNISISAASGNSICSSACCCGRLWCCAASGPRSGKKGAVLWSSWS